MAIKLGPIVWIKRKKLTPHRKNKARPWDPEQKRVFKADVERNGILRPLTITSENEILQGRRRWTVSGANDALPCRIVQGELTDQQITRLIKGDNLGFFTLPSDEDKTNAILDEYGIEEILEDRRGGNQAKRSHDLLAVDKAAERELGIPASSARRYLGRIRGEYKKVLRVYLEYPAIDDSGASIKSSVDKWRARQYLKHMRDTISVSNPKRTALNDEEREIVSSYKAELRDLKNEAKEFEYQVKTWTESLRENRKRQKWLEKELDKIAGPA